MICAPQQRGPVCEREYGPEDRERCEDGADDHPPHPGKIGFFLWGFFGRDSILPQRTRIKRRSRALVAESPFFAAFGR